VTRVSTEPVAMMMMMMLGLLGMRTKDVKICIYIKKGKLRKKRNMFFLKKRQQQQQQPNISKNQSISFPSRKEVAAARHLSFRYFCPFGKYY
jgi:hypothetical protein